MVASGLISSDESQWNRLSLKRTELKPGMSVRPSYRGGPTVLPGSDRRLRPIQSNAYGSSSENHSWPRPLYDTTSVGKPSRHPPLGHHVDGVHARAELVPHDHVHRQLVEVDPVLGRDVQPLVDGRVDRDDAGEQVRVGRADVQGHRPALAVAPEEDPVRIDLERPPQVTQELEYGPLLFASCTGTGHVLLGVPPLRGGHDVPVPAGRSPNRSRKCIRRAGPGPDRPAGSGAGTTGRAGTHPAGGRRTSTPFGYATVGGQFGPRGPLRATHRGVRRREE